MEVSIYGDDILVAWSAASLDNVHLSTEVNLNPNNEKAIFFKKLVTFLGHQIDVRGRRVLRRGPKRRRNSV